MRKILLLAAAVIFLGACGDDDTKITIETQTSILYPEAFEDGSRELVILWTDLEKETEVVDIVVKVAGWESDKPRKFKLKQTNKPVSSTYLLFAWPDLTYVDFADTVYEIAAGEMETTVPITLLKETTRLTNSFVNNGLPNMGYNLDIFLELVDADNNTRLAISDYMLTIRVYNPNYLNSL